MLERVKPHLEEKKKRVLLKKKKIGEKRIFTQRVESFEREVNLL